MVTRTRTEFRKTVTPPPRARIRSLSLTDALIAVEWLNATKGTAERESVLGFRTHLEYLRRMADTGRAGEAEFRLRHNHVNDLLSHYSFNPILTYDMDSGAWGYNAVPKKTRGRTVEVTHQGVTVQVCAATVVAALARLAAHGELCKLRLCEWCKENWRVSERECDRFCSKQCSDAHYQTRPEFNDRRKKIQKRYRIKQRREDAAALAGVRASFKGRS